MLDFIHALGRPDNAFLRHALYAGLMASVAFGMIGSYVVARRVTYIAGAIAHCCLGGIGAALYLRATYGWTWCHPMYGALVAALLSAIIIGEVSRRANQREDTVIGALWAIGMAVGMLFLSKTPGNVDAMSYLFGSILFIGTRDLYLIAGLDLIIIVLAVLFYNQFLAVCFDEEFARLRGVPVHLLHQLLLCLTALTVVLLVSIVGIVMVIALLTLPAAVAGEMGKRLWQMMGISVLLSMVFTTTGIGVSYTWDLEPGPTIILIAGAAYLLALAVSRLRLLRQRRRAA